MPSTPHAIQLTPLRCRRSAAILLEMHNLPLATGETELAEATGSAPTTVRVYLRLLEKLGLVTRRQYHYGYVLTPAGVQLIAGVLDPATGTPVKRRAWALAAEIEAALCPDGAPRLLPLQGPPLDFSKCDFAECDFAECNLAPCNRNNLEKTPLLSTSYPQPSPQPVDNSVDFEKVLEKTPVQNPPIPDCNPPENPETAANGNILEKTPLLSTGYPQPGPKTVDNSVDFGKVLEKTPVVKPENLPGLGLETAKNAPYPEKTLVRTTKNAGLEARARVSTTTAINKDLKSLKAVVEGAAAEKSFQDFSAAAVEQEDLEDSRARAKSGAANFEAANSAAANFAAANFAALHSYGVGQNNRVRAICSREDLTPEIIHAQAEKLKRRGKCSAPLLIHCLESRDPLEPPEDPHHDRSRYLEWAEGPREVSERERRRYADWANPAEARARARYTGGAAYAASWGSA